MSLERLGFERQGLFDFEWPGCWVCFEGCLGSVRKTVEGDEALLPGVALGIHLGHNRCLLQACCANREEWFALNDPYTQANNDN